MFPSLSALSRSTLFLDIVAETHEKRFSVKSCPKGQELPTKWKTPNSGDSVIRAAQCNIHCILHILIATYFHLYPHNFLPSGGVAQSVEQRLIKPGGRGWFDAHRDLRIFFSLPRVVFHFI